MQHKNLLFSDDVKANFSSVAVSTTSGLEDAYFSKSPKNVDVDSGKSVTLPCEVTPDSGITYYWELNGKELLFDPKTNLMQAFSQARKLQTQLDGTRKAQIFTSQGWIGRGIQDSSPASHRIKPDYPLPARLPHSTFAVST